MVEFAFRKKNLTRSPYGMCYYPKTDTVNLPCKVDPSYKEDFCYFLLKLIDGIIHETLHSILYNFINNKASSCLDNWMCVDFMGYMERYKDKEQEEWMEIEERKIKYWAMLREKENVKRITKKVKLGKRLSKKDYDAIAFNPFVRKKYYKAKRKYYEAKYGLSGSDEESKES